MKKYLALTIILFTLGTNAFGQRVLTLLEPVGLETWVTGSHDVRWQRTGTGWTGSDTIKIQYSDDSGATWPEDAQHIVTSGVQASLDWFPWDITSMPISPHYQVRITCNQQPSATSQSTTDFRIGNLAFYVNDASTTNDKFCTAAGSFSNDGLSASTPNTSIQYIVDNCNLEGGDIIYVDTGTYPLGANIVVGTADGGASGNPMRIVGAVEGDGTRLAVLDRNAAGTSSSRVIEVTGSYVKLENLRTTRGYCGINLTGTGAEVFNCEVYTSGNVGVNLAGTGNSATNCLVRNNTGTGSKYPPA